MTSTAYRRRLAAYESNPGAVDAFAKSKGFESSKALDAALQIAAHLERGGEIRAEQMALAKTAWPNVPKQVLQRIAREVNDLPPHQRVDRFLVEAVGPAGYGEARALAARYAEVDLSESLLERRAAREPAAPATPAELHDDVQAKRRSLAAERASRDDLRRTLERQVSGLENLMRTPAFADLHSETLGTTMIRALDTLERNRARDEKERPTLRETIAAATQYARAEAEAKDLGFLPADDQPSPEVPVWAMSDGMREEAIDSFGPDVAASIREAYEG